MLVRRYTEIVVRKLLQLDTTTQVMLGDKYVQKKLQSDGFTAPLFTDALDTIRKSGNKRTHMEFR